MSRVLLSEAARNDRRAIAAYTYEQFGALQARRLRDRFQAILESLAESPLSGRARPDLDPPGSAFRYAVALGTFVIVYEPTGAGIRVARILHGARDLATELEAEASPPDALS